MTSSPPAPSSSTSIQRTILQHLPIPELPGYESRLVRLEYPPGVAAPPHTHPVAATGVVLEGDYISQWEGDKAPGRYAAGDSLVDLGERLHVRSENASSDRPLVLLMSYVIKVDEPSVTVLDAQGK